MAFVPKLVLFNVVVILPIGTLFPFPVKLKLEVGATAVVNPLAIAPGATQLESVPVSAKPLNVKLFEFPEASVSVVTVELFPPGIP